MQQSCKRWSSAAKGRQSLCELLIGSGGASCLDGVPAPSTVTQPPALSHRLHSWIKHIIWVRERGTVATGESTRWGWLSSSRASDKTCIPANTARLRWKHGCREHPHPARLPGRAGTGDRQGGFRLTLPAVRMSFFPKLAISLYCW